jgi:hypothetical protein
MHVQRSCSVSRDASGNIDFEINVATRTVNNAITIKTKVLLTQTYVTLTDIGYPVYTFILFGFPIIRS